MDFEMESYIALEEAGPLAPDEASLATQVATILCIIMCVVIVAVNVLLAASLIARGVVNTLTICIFHMLVLDVVIGGCVFPLSIDSHYRAVWLYGTTLCDFWVTLDTLLPALIMVSCLSLTMDYLCTVTSLRYRKWRGARSWKLFLSVWISWAAALIVGVPLYVIGINANREHSVDGVCYVIWDITYISLYYTLTHFLPIFAAILCLLAATICIVANKKAPRSAGHTETTQGEGISKESASVVALALVTLSTFLMILPFPVLVLITSSTPAAVHPWVFDGLLWLGYANSALRPLLWLTDANIRQGFRKLLCGCPCCHREKIPLEIAKRMAANEKCVELNELDSNSC